MSSQEATQLIISRKPNAFAIQNITGDDVYMSLQNNENQLNIRLKNNNFIFKARELNTKLIYENIDFDVDDIRVNTISSKDNSIININGSLKNNNNNVLILNNQNKIPTTYINDPNYLIIQNQQSNIYIPNSVININTCNISNDSAITIKNNIDNQITVKLIDKKNSDVIKIYTDDPYIAIGSNISEKQNNIQLNVESNIKCNDIIVSDNSFLNFYNEFIHYKNNNDITGITTNNDDLYYSNIKIILQNDINNLRNKDDFNFIGNNFFNITNIFCTTNNTYIIANNILYKLNNNNIYEYIESFVESIKSENGVLIFTKNNKVYFKYDDNTLITEHNYKAGSYFNNYHYLINNNHQIIKKLKNNPNITILKTILNIKDIFVFNEDQYYYLVNTTYYDNSQNIISTTYFNLGYQSTYNTNSNIIVNSITSKIYELINNNLYYNSSIIETNVLKVHHSDRHIVILKDNKLYTKSFNNTYNGLGRSYTSILNNSIDSFIGLGIPTIDNINIKPSVNIGSSLDSFNNNIPNSLCVENCISIACKPISQFALRLNGDILIEGGGNIYRSEDKSIIYETDTKPLTLDHYVKYEDFDIRLDNIEHEIQNVLMSNLETNTSNINKLIFDTENSFNIWTRENNTIFVNDTRVSINPSDNDDYSVLGGNKLPALFVGNHGTNIRGIISEDDIAAYSDESLKTDINPIKNSLDKVLNLNGVNYRRKDNLEKICMGLIAQNVEKYCPEVVQEHNNIKTVAYNNLIAVLIEAIKELYTIIKNGKE
tara:strand:+ start:9647 stop:11959 length:2313 start_codon:yes stop_codon:yes gene_type:complete